MCSLNVFCTSARPLRRDIKTEECFCMIVFHQPVARMCPTLGAFICLRFQRRNSQQPKRQARTNKTWEDVEWKRGSRLPLFDSSSRIVSADRPRQWLDKISGQCGRKQVYWGWWMEYFTVAPFLGLKPGYYYICLNKLIMYEFISVLLRLLNWPGSFKLKSLCSVCLLFCF